MKTCTKCGETKPLDDFNRNRSTADGRQAWCRECMAEDKRRYRDANRDKELERQRRWRDANRDKDLERKRRWHEENRDKLLERNRRYYEENHDKVLESNRRWREENRDKLMECQRRYYEENHDHIIAANRANRAESQSMSVEMATVPLRTPWTAEEDAVLMANDGMTVFQKAVHLGRTYHSCAGRRERLRQVVTA